MEKVQMNNSSKSIHEISSNLLKLIDEFYILIFEDSSEKAIKLVEIIDKFEIIINSVENENSLEGNKEVIQKISTKLPDLLDAFENGDMLLISDILNYEIKPLLGMLN